MEVIEKPLVVLWLMEPGAMKGLLEIDWIVLIPNRSPPWISAFADEEVAFNRRIPFGFFTQESHLQQIGEIKLKPADVEVSEVGPGFTFVLRLVQHLPKRMLSDVGDFSALPSRLHLRAPIHSMSFCCNSSLLGR